MGVKAARRAVVWASQGQYLVIIINLANTIVMARLVKPPDFGTAAIGTAMFAIAEAIRSLSGTTYLIQDRRSWGQRCCFHSRFCRTIRCPWR